MSDIFREVDEEVRQDRALQFWNRYQGWLLALAVVVVAATAGWRIYASQRVARAEETGAKYLAAVQASREGKTDESLAALETIARNGTSGYRQLAALRHADELAAKTPAQAVVAFDAVGSDPGADPLFRDAARLRAALLVLDKGDAKDAQVRLGPLAGASGPYRHTARETLALMALAADDYDAAGRWFDEIVRDPGAPQDLRQRADAFLALVRSGRKPAK